MVQVSQFRLHSVRPVIFTPSEDQNFSASKLFSTVIPDFANRYDGDISSLPINQPIKVPKSGTTEFGIKIPAPTITLKSKDEQWKFESTPARTDSYWFAPEEGDEPSLRDICSQCLQPLWNYPIGVGDIQIGRLALVVRRWIPVDDPPNTLANNFCKYELADEGTSTAPFRHSVSFRLDNLKKYVSPVSDHVVNSWVRCHTGEVNDLPAIMIEQDINTLNEVSESTAFTVEQIQHFFQWVPDEMDKILNLYFPDQQQ